MTVKLPSVPGTRTCWTSCDNSSSSGLTSSNLNRRLAMGLSRLGREALGLLHRFLDGADHVEGGFRQMVVLAGGEPLEGADGVGEIDEGAGRAGEDLGHEEWLRQEALHLAGPRHRQLVLFRQLVHAENGDDVLQRYKSLQDLLHLARGLVVLVADDAGVEHARGR